MKRKVPPNIFHPDDARVMDILKQIPLRKEVRDRMTLNEADQSFMIGLLDLYEDAKVEEIADAVYKKLANTIAPILTKLEKMEENQISLSKEIVDLKGIVNKLIRKNRWGAIVLRLFLTAIVTIGLTLILFIWYHEHFMK